MSASQIRGEALGSAGKRSVDGGYAGSQDQMVWRQLDELKALDKVFPDPSLTKGCYV